MLRILLLFVLVLGFMGCRSAAERNSMRVLGDAGRGRQLLADYGCGACHSIPGVRGARGLVGPPLQGFGQRTFIAGEVPNTATNLVQWIRLPQSIEPGTAMPTIGVDENEARAMAAYLYSLR